MVEFCGSCGTSLPKGDLTIRKGRLYTSPDYPCPSCGQLANRDGENELFPAPVEVTPEKDVVIKKGKTSTE